MHTNKFPLFVLALTTALAISACGQSTDESTASDAEETTEAPAAEVSIYAAALTADGRPDADRERDAGRKPDEVLEFVGIQPGMTVLDLFTGAGYYAEIIANVVGSEGRVIAQTNQAYMNFGSVGESFNARFAGGRLSNIEPLMAENNELALEADTIDAAMLVLSFHDLYLVDDDNGWPAIDIPAYLAELRNGLKPGGVIGIIDHVGAAGIPPEESGNGVHRIDPLIVVETMQAAGFTLVDETDILRNPDDDYSKNVFAADTRGKTDRFVMVFASPD